MVRKQARFEEVGDTSAPEDDGDAGSDFVKLMFGGVMMWVCAAAVITSLPLAGVALLDARLRR